MSSGDIGQRRQLSAAQWAAVIGGLAALGVVASLASKTGLLQSVGARIGQAAWLLPALVGLHIGQLWLSGCGWRALFREPVAGLGAFHRLRIIREGIDSLLPVAQVGGEIVGARLLARLGVAPARAGASVIVDVTVELLTQVAFLAAGLCLLARFSDASAWRTWMGVLLAAAGLCGAVVALQRWGALRLLDGLLRGMVRRWPRLALTALGAASLDGIHAEAMGFYRDRTALGRSAVLHFVPWALGSIETWAVLHVLGVPVSPPDALIVESLGMAARSAGFAIPAALGAQEGGFVLAGAAIGVAAGPALALSLVKRLRETIVGGIGLALWRMATRRDGWR